VFVETADSCDGVIDLLTV